MNINNNFTPLAWHQGDIELQSNRASYAYGHIVPLIAHNQTLIPFQIITETGAVNMASYTVALYNVDGTVKVANTGLTLAKVHVVVRPADSQQGIAEIGYDVLIYNGDALNAALPMGQYYLVLTSGQNVWYSDVVTIVSNTLTMTRIEWWDESDMVFPAGRIVYRYASGGQTVQYKNRMYFLEEIGMPEYTVEEEGDTRDGLFYATKVLSGKKYKMQVAQLTEAMCDALRFVHLADNVTVRDGYGRMYYCDSVLVTPEWQTGAVASASVEITTDTFVKQVGGGYTGDNPVIENATGIINQAIINETFVINA
jgi:hypothetical protein